MSFFYMISKNFHFKERTAVKHLLKLFINKLLLGKRIFLLLKMKLKINA